MKRIDGYAPWLICGLALARAAPALAYEDQATAGIGAGYAHVLSDALPEHGIATEGALSLGLSDIWTLRGAAAFSYHPASAPLSVFLLQAELLYLVDVLELVPYAGLGVDGIGTLHKARLGTDLGAHATLGLDYLPSRELVLSLAVRPVFLLTALEHDPVYLTCMLGAALLFEL